MSVTKSLKWVPIFGEFLTTKDAITYRGKRVPIRASSDNRMTDNTDQASVGMLVSNRRISDGVLSAEVEFDKVNEETTCELIVQYSANPMHVMAAGLGGFEGTMYAIREFGGDKTSDQPRWYSHAFGGDRSGLRARTKYLIEIKCTGNHVGLTVDGVQATEGFVSSPMGNPRQVGIFCRADHKVTIRRFDFTTARPKAFVVMQFGGEFDEIYSDVVKEVTTDYEIVRVDEVPGPGLIISDIIQEISSAQLVIADITPVNANVYFEVGYAMALNKPIIFLARKGTPLPFDVAGFRVLFYENTIGGKRRLESGLRRHLDAILNY